MEKTTELKHFHRVILFLGTISLGVFALGILGALLLLRSVIRDQIMERDGILLTSVAQHFYEENESQGTGDLLDVALDSSQLRGVIGLRLFTESGENTARIPNSLHATILPEADLNQLREGQPLVRFLPKLSLDALFSDQLDFENPQKYPVTEVLSPVFDQEGRLQAVLQYWLDGQDVAYDLDRLDRMLAGLGVSLFAAGGVIFVLVFFLARNRLLRMGLLLAERNRSLEQANAELAMAARTSAIGSITSHLFHGLKNPLAGLKAYLQLTGKDEEAMAMANRMQALINESLSLISEEEESREVRLDLHDFEQMLKKRMGSALEARVSLEFSGEGHLSSREAQLLLLILQNLVDNAVEASAPDGRVVVRVAADGADFQAQVSDKGPGIPENVRGRLFEPVKSTKENGTGIGLAISTALARHIRAELELTETGPAGTTFTIRMPQ